jgi:hypothetical protein
MDSPAFDDAGLDRSRAPSAVAVPADWVDCATAGSNETAVDKTQRRIGNGDFIGSGCLAFGYRLETLASKAMIGIGHTGTLLDHGYIPRLWTGGSSYTGMFFTEV